MNRILLKERVKTFQMSRGDARLEHVRGVLRMGVGDSFDVGVVNGPVGRARIVAMMDDALDLELEWGAEPQALPAIGLVIGLPRPQTARKVLQEATSLGVRRMDFFAARKGDPAYRTSSLWADGAYEEYLIKGAEQAFDTRIPEVALHEDLESALAAAHDANARKLALDVYEGTRRMSEAVAGCADVSLALGPERGWSRAERDLLRARGYELVHLSERVLRVETATLAAIVLAQSALGLL